MRYLQHIKQVLCISVIILIGFSNANAQNTILQKQHTSKNYSDEPQYTWTIYFDNELLEGDTIYAYIWDSGFDIEYLGSYPGKPMTLNEMGLWEISFKNNSNYMDAALVKFNNGKWGEGNMTMDYFFENEQTYTSCIRFVVDGIKYEINSNIDKRATIIYNEEGQNKCAGDFAIPSTVTFANKEYTVTRIGEFAFLENMELTSITIPGSITHIGSDAFIGCYNLTYIRCDAQTPPEVSGSCFNHNEIPLFVPEGCIEAYNSAEYWCDFFDIHESNKPLPVGYEFYAKRYRYKVVEENSELAIVKSGGGYYNDIVIPESIVFNSIPFKVTTIGEEAFWGSNDITSITIPQSVTKIESMAIWSCNNLKTITCEGTTPPRSVGNDSPFSSNMYSMDIIIRVPQNCIEIYRDAEIWGKFRKIVEIGNFDTNTFEIDGIYYYLITEDNVAVTFNGSTYHEYNEYSGDVVIPQAISYNDNIYTVKKIDSHTFRNCNELTSITIPKNVTHLGGMIVGACNALTSITCLNTTPPHINENTFNNEYSYSLFVPNGCIDAYKAAEYWKNFTKIYEVDDSTSLPIGSIFNIDGINYKVISDNNEVAVTTSYYNTNGEEVVIPKDIIYNKGIYTVTSIEEYALSSFKVTSVTIPKSVKRMDTAAFGNADNLCYVTCLCTEPPTIKDDTFLNYNPILFVPEGYIESYKNAEFWSYFTHIYTIGEENIRLPAGSEFIIDGINYKITEIGSSVAVAAGGEYSGEIVIPDSITYENITYNVTSISDNAFDTCRDITSITMPNGITTIGERAFARCSGLTSITIPNSVKTIGLSAFSECSGLTYIDIPNSVTTIDYSAFSDCIGLTSITIPESVSRIVSPILNGCNGLISIAVAEGNTIYDSRNNCNAIIETATNSLIEGCQNTIIPSDITCIESRAFGYCKNLTSINIPNSITTIKSEAFAHCSGLTSIYIPENTTIIENNILEGCSGLVSIVVADGNTMYDSRNNCNAIIETATNTLLSGCQTTVIPSDIVSIAEKAFANNSNLTTIDIPDNITEIGSYAFYGCSNLRDIVIPESITTLNDWTFAYCEALTYLTIPSSVTSINQGAFYECEVLTEININAQVPPTLNRQAFESVDRAVRIQVPAGCVEAYCNAENWREFTNIREQGLTLSVGDKFFTDNLFFRIISENNEVAVTYAGSNKYSDGNNKQHIVIPETVVYNNIRYSVTAIDEFAFGQCDNLISITIPSSITYIANYAFLTSNSIIETIIVDENNPIYDSRNNCNAIIETATNTLIQGCKNTIISDGIEAIGVCAFYCCIDLTEIIFPQSITTLYDGSFAGCRGLTSVTLGDNVDICEFSFWGCNNLTEINTLHQEYLTNTDKGKEYSRKSASGYNTLGRGAFYGCEKLRSINLSENIGFIADSVFYNCNELTTITIPRNVQKIEDNCFAGCNNINSIICNASTPPTIQENTFTSRCYETAILKVPANSINNYKAAIGWANFINIQDLSGIADITEDKPFIHTENGHINIIGADSDTTVYIYSINGILLYITYTGQIGYINLPHGIYLIQVENYVQKIAI